jgi:two-component system sensor histidine kinase MtrB
VAAGSSPGLRARLLFAFALLCVVTATAVAGGMYVQARNAILQRTQDAAVRAMTTRLERVFPLRSATPGPQELGEIADAASDGNGGAVAYFRDARSPNGWARPRSRNRCAGRWPAATPPGNAWCGTAPRSC